MFSWFICWILTIFDAIPTDSAARTDKNSTLKAISDAPWFKIPYPGNS